MNVFKKDVAILRDENGRPLFVLDVQTIDNEQEYKELKARARAGLEDKKRDEKQTRYERERNIDEKINKLATAISVFINK